MLSLILAFKATRFNGGIGLRLGIFIEGETSGVLGFSKATFGLIFGAGISILSTVGISISVGSKGVVTSGVLISGPFGASSGSLIFKSKVLGLISFGEILAKISISVTGSTTFLNSTNPHLLLLFIDDQSALFSGTVAPPPTPGAFFQLSVGSSPGVIGAPIGFPSESPSKAFFNFQFGLIKAELYQYFSFLSPVPLYVPLQLLYI